VIMMIVRMMNVICVMWGWCFFVSMSMRFIMIVRVIFIRVRVVIVLFDKVIGFYFSWLI